MNQMPPDTQLGSFKFHKNKNKKEFNDLMKKASDDMIELSSLFEDADDVRATLTQMMWSNCKACHSKFRAPH